MTDAKDRSHLRLVGDDDPERDDPLFPRARPHVTPPTVPIARIPKAKLAFARISREWLADPQFPRTLAGVRLLIGLLCETREGVRVARLTPELVEEFGVAKGTKWTALAELERLGWASVERHGRETLKVRVLRSAR
jgi:hypothetical protein